MASELEEDKLDVAVVHGNYLSRGGGEHVAEALTQTFDINPRIKSSHPRQMIRFVYNSC